MTTKDIMIGDWLEFPFGSYDYLCQVKAIHANDMVEFRVNNGNVVIPIEVIRPVEITKSRLELNNFVYNRDTGTYLYERHWSMCYDIVEYEPWKNTVTLSMQRADPCASNIGNSAYSSHSVVRIESIHELQHVLKVAGINKEIKKM